MSSVLFIEKVFLGKRRSSVLRGVELFNLALIDDLTAAGIKVTILSSSAYRDLWESRPRRELLTIIYPPRFGGKLLGPAIATLGLIGKRFDSVLLGNVGDTVILPALLARFVGLGRSSSLIAHRVPPTLFLRALKTTQPRVVAVNGIIAEDFTRAGYRSVAVYYGIAHGERFYPRESAAEKPVVDFVVLGMLDNAWKGSDTAIEAFTGLPSEIRARARLHLASFLNTPPVVQDPRITLHVWAPPERMPDFIRSMDVLLVPSRDEEIMRETFSQAMVQGMLSGLPVLTSDRPVLVEKLDRGGGMVFRSVAELQDQMIRLVQDPALRLRLGQEARRTALERYVWSTETFVKRYLFSDKFGAPESAQLAAPAIGA